ncbi:MAG: DAK2 domain-containing protein [Dehalococcoidia bacterium]
MTTETTDLNLFMQMFDSSVKYFSRHVNLVNDLNVFPVPDGDTGTNMYQTLLGMQTRVSKENPQNISEYCDLLANSALYEGRGNSGVILSQIYRGVAEGVTDCNSVDLNILLNVFTCARDFAYKSVVNPVEGTMLTVLADLVDALVDQKEKSISVCESMDLLTSAAQVSVDETPEKLDVLKEGGVVDSGGYGIEIILRGMVLNFSDSDPSKEPLYTRLPESSGEGVKSMISNHTLENEEYGYCTQFILHTEIDIDTQKNLFDKVGTSLVIAGNKDSFKIHLHAEDPGPAISVAIELGIISDVSLEDMESQSQSKLDDYSDIGFSINKEIIESNIDETLLIVVSSGEGVKNLFFDAGAAVVVDGGDTLNPSVSQIFDSIDAVDSNKILILPNSKNVIAAANEASKLSDKNVIVLPTYSIPEGIECAMSFDSSMTPQENKDVLESLAEDVKTISIFSASRNVEINSINISQGQYISMLDGEFLLTSNDPIDLLIRSIGSFDVSEREQVMILIGESDMSLSTSSVEEKITTAFGDVSSSGIEIHDGGQPNYNFLVSILN